MEEEKEKGQFSIKKVESNLLLLGVTGVDDLLQENVKSCISDFRDANIKVWMLTGDKGLTAKQIGKSCGIISVESSKGAEDPKRKDSIISHEISNTTLTQHNTNTIMLFAIVICVSLSPSETGRKGKGMNRLLNN